jgi:hypothetical protein
MKKIAALKLAAAVSSLATITYGQTVGLGPLGGGGVATWSVQTNTQQWNQALGVKHTRQGCSDTPAGCLSFVKTVAQSDNVRVTLAIPLNSTTTATDARLYSQLSLSAPFLAEVSIDDFVDQYRALSKTSFQPAAVVGEVIANLKSANRNLAFGATIYEDELSGSVLLQNASLPAALRAEFDYIHLFIHYREHGPNFPGYVQLARQMFPHARIVAGSYAYDRRAYVTCAPTGPACTEQQDFDLFKQSLAVQVQEMKQGMVDHIEFYPGYFGTESQWTGWSNPRECAPGDLSACIANTVAMRGAALAILHGSTPPSWTQLSPSGIPPAARYGHSAAMDSASHRMIAFGGNSWTSAFNDTWILTNADGQHGQPAWIPVVTAGAPPAASYSTGMYDPATNRMMLYGGASGTDVWVLTNANGLGSGTPSWIQLNPTGSLGNLPTVLTDYEKHVYDPVRNVMIVYDSTAGVWTLSHANGLGGTPVWTLLNVPANGPSGRAAFTTVYDPGSNRMIVFGGSGGGTDFNDLWALEQANGLDGTPTWIPLPTGTNTVPAGRSGHMAVYDPASDAMTIFGGIGLPAESWTAAHASGLAQPPVWTLANSGVPVPDARVWCSAVLDTNSFSMIVFGGLATDLVNTVVVLSPVM